MSEEAAKIDRILRALGHPLRRRILRRLADGAGSASSMAAEFDLELTNVSYHLNRVLAGGCEAVELVETVPRRGSIEKVYRLNEDLWTDWEWFPVTVDSKAWKEIEAAKREFNKRVGAAIEESRQRGSGRRGKTVEAIVGVVALQVADQDD
jgi:DNA-binding transcriptional ArsR family regulator